MEAILWPMQASASHNIEAFVLGGMVRGQFLKRE
jgi:hypothetical protein